MNHDLNTTNEENNTLKNELHRLYAHLNKNEGSLEKVIKGKDEEIAYLEQKLSEFDSTVRKYSENVFGVKSDYDKTILDYQKALNKKNDDLRHMKEHYDLIVQNVYLYKIASK
jgi:hypothetical protein